MQHLHEQPAPGEGERCPPPGGGGGGMWAQLLYKFVIVIVAASNCSNLESDDHLHGGDKDGPAEGCKIA